MNEVRLQEAGGYFVGDLLRLTSETFEVQLVHVGVSRVSVEWPWLEVDSASNNSWDGTMGFSRKSQSYDWCNTPWRLEPDPEELEKGDSCFVGIPPTDVRIVEIIEYDPPADFGFLPRPELVLAVRPVEFWGDVEAGFGINLNSGEPIEIELIERRTRA
ncbi:hypothetical protein BJY16_007065 [Actinoplanes octamycinicus]|uniref:Uncharacterized protein n=1 Tax=Actinoplanes octamycinicus TaxID=135948 RepID=A0A7W7H447_9ACTN|nr:hypothetical protein [Actinoplanes octamycinicus]MBB4743606.1 hypothetical protein [Actinoplanes octamycinicus]GIE61031.1 hypothetical protein Aoc01nite_64330 [Actinoplanes octamycinicus]